MTQNSREILERMSLQELSIIEVLDFQLSMLLKNGLHHRFYSRIGRLSRKTLWKDTSEWLFPVFPIFYSNTKFLVEKVLNCFVDIKFLTSPILDSLQNAAKASTVNGAYS